MKIRPCYNTLVCCDAPVIGSRSQPFRLAATAAGLLVLVGMALVQPRLARAAPKAAAKDKPLSVALFRIEPLGLDAERAARLEALFRMELERLAGAALPHPGRIERAVAKDNSLRDCTGELRCLSAIGRLLGVEHIVAGNVGELGGSYIINLKLVSSASSKEVRRISEPLRGNPDELIEAMRIAAHKLVSPDRLQGSVAILSDVSGADVMVDGRNIGKTPLKDAQGGLSLGKHSVRLVASGYTDFMREVDVNFEKTTQVVVRMVAAQNGPGGALAGPRLVPVVIHQKGASWLASNWGYVVVGAGAVIVGALVGLAIAPDNHVINCESVPSACVP